jgi:chromosome segregation ATPase
MEEAIGQMEKKKEEHKEQIESLQQDFLKERDEPNRLGKGNENLKKAVEHLKSDLDKLVADTKAVES